MNSSLSYPSIHGRLSSTLVAASKALRDDTAAALYFSLLALVVYAASVHPIALLAHERQSEQTHYAYLARSFLSGRVDVVSPDPRLSELVSRGGKSYVVYPPMPAVLLMPAVFVFGERFPTSAFSILLAALSGGVAYLMLRRAGFTQEVSSWVTILFTFGTGFWYHSLNGSSWYLGHVVAVFFLLLALFETYGRGRPLLIGLAIGAATLSRLPVILATPYFLYELLQEKRESLRRTCWLLLGVGLAVGLYGAYNWGRFGSVFETGYAIMPGGHNELWYRYGILNLRYLPRNLYAMLFQAPMLIDRFPFIIPSTFGTALIFTSPAVLLMFGAPGDRWTLALAAAAALVAMPSLLHGWPGATQFGYRFSLDFTPFLLILTARGLGQGVSGKARLLILLSCALSLWGVRYATWIKPQWLFDLTGW